MRSWPAGARSRGVPRPADAEAPPVATPGTRAISPSSHDGQRRAALARHLAIGEEPARDVERSPARRLAAAGEPPGSSGEPRAPRAAHSPPAASSARRRHDAGAPSAGGSAAEVAERDPVAAGRAPSRRRRRAPRPRRAAARARAQEVRLGRGCSSRSAGSARVAHAPAREGERLVASRPRAQARPRAAHHAAVSSRSAPAASSGRTSRPRAHGHARAASGAPARPRGDRGPSRPGRSSCARRRAGAARRREPLPPRA